MTGLYNPSIVLTSFYRPAHRLSLSPFFHVIPASPTDRDQRKHRAGRHGLHLHCAGRSDRQRGVPRIRDDARSVPRNARLGRRELRVRRPHRRQPRRPAPPLRQRGDPPRRHRPQGRPNHLHAGNRRSRGRWQRAHLAPGRLLLGSVHALQDLAAHGRHVGRRIRICAAQHPRLRKEHPLHLG